MRKAIELFNSNTVTKSRYSFSNSASTQMSKKQTKSKNKTAESTKLEAIREIGGNIIIQVLAKPGAKHNNITVL